MAVQSFAGTNLLSLISPPQPSACCPFPPASPHKHRRSGSASQIEDEPICEYFPWAEVKIAALWCTEGSPFSLGLGVWQGYRPWMLCTCKHWRFMMMRVVCHLQLSHKLASFIPPGPRRSSAGDLVELVGGGRGLWLSCLPAWQLCLANPHVPGCLQEKQGISLQAII